MPQPLVVTAAIVLREGRVLITQRLPNARHPGLWEFPGGKLEEHESPEEALVREISEELGVALSVGDIFDVIYYRYAWGNVLLLAYLCELSDEPLRHLEVADHRWVKPDELDRYPLLPADRPLISRLQALKTS